MHLLDNFTGPTLFLWDQWAQYLPGTTRFKLVLVLYYVTSAGCATVEYSHHQVLYLVTVHSNLLCDE